MNRRCPSEQPDMIEKSCPDLKDDLAPLLFQLWPLPGDDDAEQLVDEAGLGDGEVDHRDLGRRFRREVRILETGCHLY